MAESNGEKKGWQDWPGLLKWSLQYQDGTSPSEASKEMDEEKRKWLEEALAAAAPGEVGGMKEDLKIICSDCGKCFEKTLSDEELELKEAAVERIHDVVDNLDNAKDLIPLGGFEPLLELLECQYPSLVGHIASLLAVAVQNHPACQQHCHEVGALNHVLSAFDQMKNQGTRAKLMSFLSSLVRGGSPVFAPFIQAGGVSTLMAVLSDPESSDRLLSRTLFLLSCLTREYPKVLLSKWEKTAVPELLCLLKEKKGDWSLVESIFGFLSQLSSDQDTWIACGGADAKGDLVPFLLSTRQEIAKLSKEDQDPLFDLIEALNAVTRNVLKK
jgi:hypothetical protein